MKEDLIKIQENRKYLRMLSQKYPSVLDVTTRIVDLSSHDVLPKGTEHFMSDIHGEADAFIHILNNASGVIREKVDQRFGHILSEDERANFATLVYYPRQKVAMVKRSVKNMHDWYKITIQRLVELVRVVSSKYSSKIVHERTPQGFEYIIDELLHTNYDDTNKEKYYNDIISTIIELDQAGDLIVALCSLIKALAVDRLHILGDVFDRGPRPDIILDQLIDHHSVDFQWGNHDILWMGAACGSRACIANVLNVALQYNNTDLIENIYGISLRELSMFADETYAPCPVFTPKVVGENLGPKEIQLFCKMKKAIDVIMFKLEGRIIKRRPEFHMEDRLLLDKIDYENKCITIRGITYPLRDCDFPTVDPANPYELTDDERRIMRNLKNAFKESEKLRRHMNFLYTKGGMYTRYNANLLFHSCVPMNEDGSFTEVEVEGVKYSGRALMHVSESMARRAYMAPKDSEERSTAKDFMWYLWCGPDSPLFGRARMTTFERCLIEDKDSWKEPQNPYYDLANNEDICLKILEEFELRSEHSHIINGHVPVKVKKGESPIKGNGRLLLIDGGFSRAYHKTTGIAGYTLIYNSHGMRIVAHDPFTSTEDAVENNTDIHSTSNLFEFMDRRLLMGDTDGGEVNREKIEDLKMLLKAYRMGVVKPERIRDKARI